MAVAEKARAEGGRARRWPFFFREAAPLREAWRKRTGESRRQGSAACMAARKTPGPEAGRSSCQYIGSWMRAVESAAPEGSAPRAPGPRGGPHTGRGEAPARRRPPPAPPRWSCRHPVRGRVSRPRRAGGAYNAELAAAKGRSPEGGAPRGPRDGREKLSEKSS